MKDNKDIDDIEVKIRIFDIEHGGAYVDLINGNDESVIIHTDIDERGIQVSMKQFILALSKINHR